MVSFAVPVLHARNQILEGRHGPNPQRFGVWARVPASRRHVHSPARHAGVLRAIFYLNPPPSRPSVGQHSRMDLLDLYPFLKVNVSTKARAKATNRRTLTFRCIQFVCVCHCHTFRTALSCSTFPRTCCGWTRTSATANRRPRQRWAWWTQACKRTPTHCCRGPKRQNW